jgi:hypothetical protein
MLQHAVIILATAVALTGATVVAQKAAPTPASGAGIVRAHAELREKSGVSGGPRIACGVIEKK